MTIALRGHEPIVVDVALGARSYDIVIGRGTLASLGLRIAQLRPGAKVAVTMMPDPDKGLGADKTADRSSEVVR